MLILPWFLPGQDYMYNLLQNFILLIHLWVSAGLEKQSNSKIVSLLYLLGKTTTFVEEFLQK